MMQKTFFFSPTKKYDTTGNSLAKCTHLNNTQQLCVVVENGRRLRSDRDGASCIRRPSCPSQRCVRVPSRPPPHTKRKKKKKKKKPIARLGGGTGRRRRHIQTSDVCVCCRPARAVPSIAAGRCPYPFERCLRTLSLFVMRAMNDDVLSLLVNLPSVLCGPRPPAALSPPSS